MGSFDPANADVEALSPPMLTLSNVMFQVVTFAAFYS
jgi:hypothetical protein